MLVSSENRPNQYSPAVCGIYVVVSGSDRALGLSALLRGQREQLGSIHNADELRKLGVG